MWMDAFLFMADDSLSLLFRLRADNSQAKATVAETKAAIASLRTAFGSELGQMQTVSTQAFGQIRESLTNFANSVPGGRTFVSLTSGLTGLGTESNKATPALKEFNKSVEELSKTTGKSSAELVKFLGEFVKLPGAVDRGIAGYTKFGSKYDDLQPKLEQAGIQLGKVAAESEAAGAGIGSMAAPVGIAALAFVGLAAGIVAVTKQLFDLSKRTADVEGRMFDLSQQTGVAVETLSALEIAAKTTGGNLNSITQSLVLFQRKLEEAQDPTSNAADRFKELGVSVNDTETAFREALTAIAAMPEGFSQTNAAAELFGARGGKQVLAILKETNGDLDGAIARFRAMGILISDDVARAADKFNDEFALLEFQLRALSGVAARELIPAMIEIVRGLGDMVEASRPVAALFGTIAGPVVRTLAGALRGLGTVIAVVTGNYLALAAAAKKAREEQGPIPVQSAPDAAPVSLPGTPTSTQSTAQAVAQAETIVTAVRRTAAETNQALNAMFEQGRINRDKEVAGIIAANKQVLEADKSRIDALLAQKDDEVRGLRERADLSAGARQAEIDRVFREGEKLQQERLDKEAEFELTSKALRDKAAKENADSRRNQAQNETDILISEYDRQIKETEAAIEAGSAVENEGLALIEQLEQLKIEARRDGFERQKLIGFLTIEDQQNLNNEIQRLNQEADQLSEDQAQRRLARERATAERSRQIQLDSVDALLEVEQIRAESFIASQLALAALRVKTEEDAAKEILKIRLGLIDSEIEATKGKLESASEIIDVNERTKTQADLNNRLKVLKAERVATENQGNRDVDEARKTDLANERAYADDLTAIRERLADIERDSAQEIINLMIIHFASRRDIIRAQVQLDLEDEDARHRNALQGISALRQENAESKRTKEEKLRVEEEINRLEEAEAERHRLAMKGIKGQGKKDEAEADPLGRLGLGKDQLREFAAELEASIVPLNEILARSFFQVADAIGQTVSNWVLLGETGPAVMRKILAQALASIAAEAAVNAVKELALGFATLFLNPAESAGHFTAAALWGSIGGIAAIAGRGIAGDLFKQKGAASGSGGGREGSPQGLQTIVQDRNRPQPTVIVVRLEADIGELDKVITSSVVRNIGDGGEIREVISRDGRAA